MGSSSARAGLAGSRDYAFKRVYGSQRNADILVHLLNAIPRPEIAIRSVEILNPFSEKDLAEDDLVQLTLDDLQRRADELEAELTRKGDKTTE